MTGDFPPVPAPRPHEIRHRVQANIELPPGDAIETVEPANGVVPLENADAFPEMSQANAGRQARHSRPNDRNVVVRS